MPDASTLFELLAARPRRRVLFRLSEESVVDLAEIRGSPPQTGLERPSEPPRAPGAFDGSGPQADQRAIRLYHTHLPKLESAGLITWGRESRTVARGPAFDDVESALETIRENESDFPPELL